MSGTLRAHAEFLVSGSEEQAQGQHGRPAASIGDGGRRVNSLNVFSQCAARTASPPRLRQRHKMVVPMWKDYRNVDPANPTARMVALLRLECDKELTTP